MIRTTDITNITDILDMGVERYAHGQYAPGSHQIRFVGEKIFAFYIERSRFGRVYSNRSDYVDGDGDNVVEFALGGALTAVTKLWLTLYHVTYLEIDGEVIFDRR